MSQDRFTEITTRSWGDRIKGSLGGTVFGFLMFLAAFPLLFWNEGRAVQTAKALEEGAQSVVSVGSDAIDPANEGRLVHVSGTPATDETLRDPVFGLQVQAIHLRRTVEMYQWQESSHSETREKLGGGTETTTTYSYAKDWSERAISSSGFRQPEGHQNPGSLPFEGAKFSAREVTLGVFRLSAGQVARIGNFTPLTPDQSVVEEARRAQQRPVNLEGQALYLGANPARPRVGDLRIRFAAVQPAPISLIARQQGNSFVPFVARSGGIVDLLDPGLQSAEQMFQAAEVRNSLTTWLLRLLGLVLMYLGLRTVLRVLETLAAVLPVLGHLVGFGLGLLAGLLSLSLSLVTVALAWIFYRPLLGIALLVLAVGSLAGLRFARRNPAAVSVET
jgi:hypothetical protein